MDSHSLGRVGRHGAAPVAGGGNLGEDAGHGLAPECGAPERNRVLAQFPGDLVDDDLLGGPHGSGGHRTPYADGYRQPDRTPFPGHRTEVVQAVVARQGRRRAHGCG